LRTFLLETSILDRMCAPLCHAVSGRTDGQTTLEHLEHANLFVIPLDDERRWYRYHHLFADVLRQRLRQRHPAILPVLHQRASGWFEEEGLASEAIHHALAAADWERATRLLVHFLPPVAFSGQFHTALSWLDALPDTLVSSNPSLCVYHAGVLMFTNQVEAAEIRLRDAEGSIQDGPSEDQARIIRGQVAAIRAAIARIYGDLALCVDLGRQALDLLSEPEVVPLRLRTAAALSAARAYLVSGDVTGASESAVASVVAPLRASGNRYGALLSMTNLARLHVLQGRLRQAASTYQEAMVMVSEFGEMQGLVGGPTYYFGLGDLYREWNDLGAAQSHLEQGMELVKGSLTVDADTVLVGYLGMVRLRQALGDPNGALATLEEFAQLARQRNFFAPCLARAAAEEARVRLAQCDLMAAARWAEASGLRADDELNYPQEKVYLTLARVLTSQGREEPSGRPLDDALGLLDRLLRAAEDGGRMGSVIEILVLRALALREGGDPSEALVTLQRALMLAEPEGYVRVFVDEGEPMAALVSELPNAWRKGPREPRHRALLGYVRRLLGAFEAPHQSPDPSTEPPLLASLTTREREVLKLLAEGLSNQEIAAQLFIATSTVKGYVHSIFRKFEVDNRTKAIARAHELHLVSESE
jgi:LuxR family maltose regulon positive regulatory protein